MEEKYGYLLGRFQPMHIGHQLLIEEGIKQAGNGKFLVLIGSSQESGTVRNPFSYELRKKLIYEIYGDRVLICPIPDLSNENDVSPEWGRYVIECVKSYLGRTPDFTIYGNDPERELWYDEKDIYGVSNIIVDRNGIKISGTELRDFILNDDIENWKKYLHPKIHKYYPELKQALLAIN